MSLGEAPLRIVAVSAGTSDPSTSRMLADRAVEATGRALRERGHTVSSQTIELAPIASEIAQSLVSGLVADPVATAISALASADAIVVSTPVYKASLSGLFLSFIDLLDNDLLIATPVLLTATAGSARHAMVVDEQLRPLFAFLRALPAPTSLFAAPEEWGSADFGTRIERAAGELALLASSGIGRSLAEAGWGTYSHSFAGNATRSAQSADDVDTDTDLMRLARGGR